MPVKEYQILPSGLWNGCQRFKAKLDLINFISVEEEALSNSSLNIRKTKCDMPTFCTFFLQSGIVLAYVTQEFDGCQKKFVSS